MATTTPKTPWYRAPWFWVLALLMLGLRIGYKMQRQDERPSYETRMEKLNARTKKLEEQIRASQAASTAPVVIADSAMLTDTTTSQR